MSAVMTPLEIVRKLRRDLAPEWAERTVLNMCEPCWDDLCIACQGGACPCACQDWDEPPVRLAVREAPARCGGCGYLTGALGCKLTCGRAA